MRGLPSAARVLQSADAGATAGAHVVPGVPREYRGNHGAANHYARWHTAGISRSAQPALSELHDLPRQDPRFERKQGASTMRLASLLFISIAMLAQTAPEEKPVPAERSLTGSVDLGYRWISGVGGSFDTYRSIVDLGEGPKLFGVDLTLAQPGNKFFDRAEIHGNNWGDPYNTARARIVKTGIYDFSADYRNIAYFNFLPSFANPLIDRGVILNERSFDIHRRMANFNLELRPGA